VDVVHPDLAVWGITRVIIRKLKPKKIPDFYEIAFDMLEHFPQPKPTAAPGSTSGATKSFWNALDGSPDPRTSRPAQPSTTRLRP
jgi:hypothetical protein